MNRFLPVTITCLIVSFACFGCPEASDDGDSVSPGDPPAPPPAELVEAAGIEAPTSAWPSDTEGLLDSLAAIESLDSCRARLREAMSAEVAEALADIGYEQVLDDVCAGLVAVRDGSEEGCDALSVSALRRGCRRRLAIVAGRPEACPEDATIDGREPVCLAWARRDPGLCRAANPAEQARCRAVLADDPAMCRRQIAGERERCEAQVRRYASALGEERTETAAGEVEPTFRITAEVLGEDGEPREPIVVERDVLARGVHLEARGCGWRLSLRNPTGELPAPVSFTDRPPTAELQVDLPASLETPRAIPFGPSTAAMRVVLPGVGEATSLVGAEGDVTITDWSGERGGLVAGEIDGVLAMTPGRVRVRGSFRTFVRDLEPPSCGPGEQAP